MCGDGGGGGGSGGGGDGDGGGGQGDGPWCTHTGQLSSMMGRFASRENCRVWYLSNGKTQTMAVGGCLSWLCEAHDHRLTTVAAAAVPA